MAAPGKAERPYSRQTRQAHEAVRHADSLNLSRTLTLGLTACFNVLNTIDHIPPTTALTLLET